MKFRVRLLATIFVVLVWLCGACGTVLSQDGSGAPVPIPTVYVAGDSTASNGVLNGWGSHFYKFFDPASLLVVNRARGGRSSRTFVTEGLWEAILQDLKAGDTVLIQFGHNDAGRINDPSRARGSIPTLGEETQEIDNQTTGKHEVVHTFGWYMRKMIADTKARGAAPIVDFMDRSRLNVENHAMGGTSSRSFRTLGLWDKVLARVKPGDFVILQFGHNRIERVSQGCDTTVRQLWL